MKTIQRPVKGTIFSFFGVRGNWIIGLTGAIVGVIVSGSLLHRQMVRTHDVWITMLVAATGACAFLFVANLAHVASGFKKGQMK